MRAFQKWVWSGIIIREEVENMPSQILRMAEKIGSNDFTCPLSKKFNVLMLKCSIITRKSSVWIE